jgi:hypothetical protein
LLRLRGLQDLGLIGRQAAQLNECIDPDEVEGGNAPRQFADDSPGTPKIAV